MNRFSALAIALFGTAICAQPALAARTPTFILFFTEDSSDIKSVAHDIVDQAAAFARAHPHAVVQVSGFAPADDGVPNAETPISEARALAVANMLANAKIPPSHIRIEAEGSTPYALMPAESRRVEIAITDADSESGGLAHSTSYHGRTTPISWRFAR